MSARRLVFLGKAADTGDERAVGLRCEGQPLQPEAAVELRRRRSPWRDGNPQVRVIVGSHPSRSDILLEGESIYPEHLRIYFPADGDAPLDMRAMHDDSTTLNGEPVAALEWITLTGGELIELGPWRWRYEPGSPG